MGIKWSLIKTNFISFKNSDLRNQIYLYYKKISEENNWKLNYNPNKSIIIHVRLWDEAPKELVKNKRAPHAGAHQPERFIGENNLINLLTYLNKKFNEHKIMLCTTPNEIDINICKNIIKKTNIDCEIINTPQKNIEKLNPFNKDDTFKRIVCGNEEYDIWRMMNCDILIMSPSMFPMFAGFLHNGSHVYLPHFYRFWKHFYDMGYTNKKIFYIFKT